MRAMAIANRGVGELLDDVRVGEQGDGLASHLLHALAAASCSSRSSPVRRALIGGDEVAALGLGDRREEVVPFVGEDLDGAVLVEPVELVLREQGRCRAAPAR